MRRHRTLHSRSPLHTAEGNLEKGTAAKCCSDQRRSVSGADSTKPVYLVWGTPARCIPFLPLWAQCKLWNVTGRFWSECGPPLDRRGQGTGSTRTTGPRFPGGGRCHLFERDRDESRKVLCNLHECPQTLRHTSQNVSTMKICSKALQQRTFGTEESHSVVGAVSTGKLLLVEAPEAHGGVCVDLLPCFTGGDPFGGSCFDGPGARTHPGTVVKADGFQLLVVSTATGVINVEPRGPLQRVCVSQTPQRSELAQIWQSRSWKHITVRVEHITTRLCVVAPPRSCRQTDKKLKHLLRQMYLLSHLNNQLKILSHVRVPPCVLEPEAPDMARMRRSSHTNILAHSCYF